MDRSSRIPLEFALEVLAGVRGESVVVTTMSTTRPWLRTNDHPLDFNYIPSTMGGGIPLALGIALAQPSREVIVLCGDGSLLMSLGSLVTVVAGGAKNLSIVLFENGIYEVTGGQKLPVTRRPVDYAAIASASGIESVIGFDTATAWQSEASDALTLPGPRLITLRVERAIDGSGDVGSMQQQIVRFRQAIGSAR